MTFATFKVTVHPFHSATPSSCAYERGGPSRNALIYISGLTSGPHTAPQMGEAFIHACKSAGLDYSLWEFRMRSSYTGFGYSSLANDAEDLAALVKYIRGLWEGKEVGKVVVVGSSSGCQAIMTYVKEATFPSVDAYVLQAPTSDRETAGLLIPTEFMEKTRAHAESMIRRREENEIMPSALIPPIFTSPISAYRWHSLLAVGGDDDFFAAGILNEVLHTTFGKLDKPTLILPSEKDEMVPLAVDKVALLERWKAAGKGMVSVMSEVVSGVDHGLSGEGMVEAFMEKVVRFLEGLEA